MKNWIRFFITILTSLTFLFITALKTPPSKRAVFKKQKIFISSFMTMHDPFFVSLNEGIRKAVAAHGDSLIFLDGNHDTRKQEEDILAILNQDIAGIFILPATHDGCIDRVLAAAKQRRIPVIIVDTDFNVHDSMIVCKVLSDNTGAGKLSCNELAKVNPDAKVGILSFSLSKGCVERVNGFTEEMAKYPGMKIIGVQDGHANKDGVNGVIKEFLAKTPDMDAIFAINDVSAIAANEGIEKSGRSGKILVLGVAGSREGARAILDGKMLSTCAQRPLVIGNVAVGKAFDYIAGKKVEKIIRVPVTLVTKENAAEYLQ
jgi:ribose transport system substrate-binding protein